MTLAELAHRVSFYAQVKRLLGHFYTGTVQPLLLSLQKRLLEQGLLNMEQTVYQGSVGHESLTRTSQLHSKLTSAIGHAAAIAEALSVQPLTAEQLQTDAAALMEKGRLALAVLRAGENSTGDSVSAMRVLASSETLQDEANMWRDKEER